MRKIPVSVAIAFLLASCGGGGDTVVSDAVAADVRSGTQNSEGTSVAASTPSTPSTPSAPAAPLAPLGVNLEALTSYSRLPPFVDMMKLSRHWGTAATPWDEAATVDARGWPTTDAGVVIATSTTDLQADPGDDTNAYAVIPQGTYKLTFTGRANVGPVASAVRVTNMVYDAATNRSAADVVVGANAYQMMLGFTGTNGGVSDVTLLRPGYTSADTFTREFKAAVAPFSVVRFMDFLATNGNPVTTWAERRLPTDATQAGAKGGAYEYAVQMGNELGKDVWLNIPVGADDDFVRQLATLLNRSLAPGRIVYLEYSNEVWNSIFPQSGANMDAAITEVVAGDSSLVDGATCTRDQMLNGADPCNKYWAGWRRVAKRIGRISQIFSEVMGPAAFNTRYRPILATQWSNRSIGEGQLMYLNKYIGAPKNLVYAIAGAPYYGLTSLSAMQAAVTDPALTVDQLVQDMQAYVTAYYPQFKPNMTYAGQKWSGATQKSLADYYGIRSVAYEGGEDLGQSTVNLANKTLATKDPRIGAIQTDYWGQWFGCGNDLFMQYTVASAWGRYGYWGLTNNQYALSGPKYQSAKQVASTPRANFSTCK